MGPPAPDGPVCADRVLFETRESRGSTFVIDLGEFIRSLGGTERTAMSLKLIGEAMIKRRLGNHDTFAFDPQGFFVIRLREPNPMEARRRAEAITDDLGVRAVGERFVSWARMDDAVRRTRRDPANDDRFGSLREQSAEDALATHYDRFRESRSRRGAETMAPTRPVRPQS